MINFWHTKRRVLAALLLTVVYLAVTLSPLAPLALQSPSLAHAITGECSGDCDICGCSAEARANHTCCCAQKKKHDSHDDSHDDSPLPDCCKKKAAKKVTVLKCNCPCGSGKTLALLNPVSSELLPFVFVAGELRPFTIEQYSSFPRTLSSRRSDPPEPPPRLTTLS